MHVYACEFLAAGCWFAARERRMSVVFTGTWASQLTFRIGSCGALSCQILVVAQLRGRQCVRRIAAEARVRRLGAQRSRTVLISAVPLLSAHSVADTFADWPF